MMGRVRRVVLLLCLIAPVLLCAPAHAAVFPSSASQLTLRATPAGKVVGRVRAGTLVDVRCQRNGPVAAGRSGATRVWDRVRVRGRLAWVSDGWVDTGTSGLVAPPCAPAPCAIAAPFPLLPPFATAEDFIAAALEGAVASREQFGVPVSVTLAQGVLETGGGKLAALANNFFGLKAHEPGVPCVLKKTREVRGGRGALEIAGFRTYASLTDSVLDHGRRLATNPVYAPAFRTTTVEAFARAVARRYATDPAYGDKVVALMDRYDLRRFDVE